jgi:hypothetical protein
VLPSSRPPRTRSALEFVAVALAGVVPRLAWAAAFPARPFSDFRAIVEFALSLKDSFPARGASYWWHLNPGTSFILAFLLGIHPGNAVAVSRLATVLATGLVPLIPLLLWNDPLIAPARWRTALMLALWPGQIFFSTVVSQDNWLLLPTVSLACLAVGALARQELARPIGSALCYGVAFLVRSEMLVVLLPLSLAAAGFRVGRKPDWRAMGRWGAATLLMICSASFVRWEASGRFSLTTPHAGWATLNAYVPGAGADLTNPAPYVASIAPLLAGDRPRLDRESFRLVEDEFVRRPTFHLVRMLATALGNWIRSDARSLFWSVGAAEALPPELRQAGALWRSRLSKPLILEELAILGAFLAVLFAARRDAAIGLLALTVALKVGLHGATVAQPRYFFPATALEIVVIGLGARLIFADGIRTAVPAVLAGFVCALGMAGLARMSERYVLAHDEAPSYPFQLRSSPEGDVLRCNTLNASFASWANSEKVAGFSFSHADPAPGERAEAVCQLLAQGAPHPLSLQILDDYPRGGFPGRFLLAVIVDGREVLRFDLAAEPGAGWTPVFLGSPGEGDRRKIAIRLLAGHPELRMAWGPAPTTNIRLAGGGQSP